MTLNTFLYYYSYYNIEYQNIFEYILYIKEKFKIYRIKQIDNLDNLSKLDVLDLHGNKVTFVYRILLNYVNINLVICFNRIKYFN